MARLVLNDVREPTIFFLTVKMNCSNRILHYNYLSAVRFNEWTYKLPNLFFSFSFFNRVMPSRKVQTKNVHVKLSYIWVVKGNVFIMSCFVWLSHESNAMHSNINYNCFEDKSNIFCPFTPLNQPKKKTMVRNYSNQLLLWLAMVK